MRTPCSGSLVAGVPSSAMACAPETSTGRACRLSDDEAAAAGAAAVMNGSAGRRWRKN
eukprot:COSAG06_NODE_850_length_11961_cov_34.663126_6_plen_58_part_00